MAVRLIVTSWLIVLLLEFPSTSSQELTASFDDCEGVTCITKCCPEGKMINLTSCVVPTDEEDLWWPTFHDEHDHATLAVPPKVLRYIYSFPMCDSFPLMPHAEEDDQFYLLEDGSLRVPLYGKSYDVSMYCVDKISISLDETVEFALLCFEDPVEEPSKACEIVKQYVYPLFLIVSCVFLIITLFVYVCIPELRGKLHGRCLVSMISSLLAGYILMAVVYLASEDMNPVICQICASMKQMTILASFFWYNVMCFDIWRSFNSMRPASETSARSRQRFLLYSLYAWGCPILIGIISVIIEKLPESHENVARPNFLNPLNTCWFYGKSAIWFHFYMILLILVVTNIIFFVMVAYILLKSQRNVQLQRARSQNRDRMWLYGRLFFLVMGITWITEVISWQQGTCEAWIFTDIINALQGFTIFLVFVCKKSTRQLVNRRLSKMKSNYTSSSGTGSRSTTFFTSLSKSSSRNTDSSISHSTESRGLTGTPQSELAPRTQSDYPSYPLSPMSVINETENTSEDGELTSPERTDENHHAGDIPPSDVIGDLNRQPEIDEDCPSIAGEREEKHENTGRGQGQGQVVAENPISFPIPTTDGNETGQQAVNVGTFPASDGNQLLHGVDGSGSEPMVNGFDHSMTNGNNGGNHDGNHNGRTFDHDNLVSSSSSSCLSKQEELSPPVPKTRQKYQLTAQKQVEKQEEN